MKEFQQNKTAMCTRQGIEREGEKKLTYYLHINVNVTPTLVHKTLLRNVKLSFIHEVRKSALLPPPPFCKNLSASYTDAIRKKILSNIV